MSKLESAIGVSVLSTSLPTLAIPARPRTHLPPDKTGVTTTTEVRYSTSCRRESVRQGRLPEWPKGAVCKTVGSAYASSNLAPATPAETARHQRKRGGGPFAVCPAVHGRQRRSTVVRVACASALSPPHEATSGLG